MEKNSDEGDFSNSDLCNKHFLSSTFLLLNEVGSKLNWLHFRGALKENKIQW